MVGRDVEEDADTYGLTLYARVYPRIIILYKVQGWGETYDSLKQIRPLDELWALWEPHQSILRPILGLGRDGYVFAVYHPCPLFITPGVLISGQ